MKNSVVDDYGLSTHTVQAQRSIVVYREEKHGQPNTKMPSYALHRVDIDDRRAYVLGCVDKTVFDVSVVRPANYDKPARVSWFKAKQSDPLLFTDRGLIPKNLTFWQGINKSLLRYVSIFVLALCVLWYAYLPKNPSLDDLLASRYPVAILLTIAIVLWVAINRHRRRFRFGFEIPVWFCRHTLKLAPTGLRSGTESAVLDSRKLMVRHCTVADAVHWIEEGPIIGDSETSPITCFRFVAEDRTFRGVAENSYNIHAFIVPGDQLRVIAKEEENHELNVLAYANLSDGHVWVNSAYAFRWDFFRGSDVVTILFFSLFFFVPCFWLMGPMADPIAAALLAAGLLTLPYMLFIAGRQRRERGEVAKALGSSQTSLDACFIEIPPRVRSSIP